MATRFREEKKLFLSSHVELVTFARRFAETGFYQGSWRHRSSLEGQMTVIGPNVMRSWWHCVRQISRMVVIVTSVPCWWKMGTKP